MLDVSRATACHQLHHLPRGLNELWIGTPTHELRLFNLPKGLVRLYAWCEGILRDSILPDSITELTCPQSAEPSIPLPSCLTCLIVGSMRIKDYCEFPPSLTKLECKELPAKAVRGLSSLLDLTISVLADAFESDPDGEPVLPLLQDFTVREEVRYPARIPPARRVKSRISIYHEDEFIAPEGVRFLFMLVDCGKVSYLSSLLGLATNYKGGPLPKSLRYLALVGNVCELDSPDGLLEVMHHSTIPEGLIARNPGVYFHSTANLSASFDRLARLKS